VLPGSASEKALPFRVAVVPVIEVTDPMVGVLGAVFDGAAVVKL
jgi:hypothetical protein